MKTLNEILANPLKLNQPLILQLIQLIDLTDLDPTATTAQLQKLILEANKGFQGIHVAAVCSYSTFGELLKSELRSKIKTAVVGGCFPTGQTLSQAKIEECKLISATGVDEIDIVLNRFHFFEGMDKEISAEISGIKSVIGSTHLKVILETGDYQSQEEIAHAADLAIAAGADFIKTSTGKSSEGATPEAVYTMCNRIKHHFETTGKRIGIKPSGGIRTPAQAITYYSIVQEILGEDWLNSNYFRIGASSLYTELIKAYLQ